MNSELKVSKFRYKSRLAEVGKSAVVVPYKGALTNEMCFYFDRRNCKWVPLDEM